MGNKKKTKKNKTTVSLFVDRDFAKAATFEGHEIREPSVKFPVLQKTTVNVLMSVPRLLLKRKAARQPPGCWFYTTAGRQGKYQIHCVARNQSA